MPEMKNEEQIIKRMTNVVEQLARLQFREPGQIPNTEPKRYHQGEFPAKKNILLAATKKEPGKAKEYLDIWPFLSLDDAHGSTLMGFMFLADAYRHLREREKQPVALVDELSTLLGFAEPLPGFFQGDQSTPPASDPQSPKGAMGWWPLVDGWRMPAAIFPDSLLSFLAMNEDDLKMYLASLSDCDIWGWAIDINSSLPEAERWDGTYPLDNQELFLKVLGSEFSLSEVSPHAMQLIEWVTGTKTPEQLPIGTYYAHVPKRQRFCCVVNASVLAAIPLNAKFQQLPVQAQQDISYAATFVDQATLRLTTAQGDQKDLQSFFELYAYSYALVFGTPLAYVLRYHRKLEELRTEGGVCQSYPSILTPKTVDVCKGFVRTWTERLLRDGSAYQPTADGGLMYVSLIYGANAWMNLLYTLHCTKQEVSAEDMTFAQKLVEALLVDNPAASAAPGTGPYPFYPPYKPGSSEQKSIAEDRECSAPWSLLGQMLPHTLVAQEELMDDEAQYKLELMTVMGSQALVFPPLVEAMSLFLVLQEKHKG